MSGVDIFLSYARADQPVARIFAEGFAAEGFSVWWDGSLRSGETFDEVIEQKLRDSKAVVVLWSQRSVASRWVRAEATQADRRNKLAPAMIEPCDRPIIFELTHAAELSGWAGDTSDPRWRIFMADLRRLVDRESEGETGSAVRPHASRSAPQISAMPAPPIRRPLRPGADDVVSVAGKKAVPPVEEQLRRHVAAEAPAEVHCLELSDDELGEDLFVIDSPRLMIGRTPPADIVLSHRSISRQHCLIGLANDELVVTDLNSTNGTYINDVKIDRATILPVGSAIRLGHVSLRHAVRDRADDEQIVLQRDVTDRPKPGRLAATS